MKDPWYTFTLWLLVVGAVVVGALQAFDPFEARHFLLDATYSRTIIPIAHAGGAVIAVLLMLSLLVAFIRAYRRPDFRGAMPGIFPDVNGERIVTTNTTLIFVIAMIVMGIAIYFVVNLSILTHAPYVRHLLAQTVETTERFTIRYYTRQRNCPGFIAINAAFYSERICAVKLFGDLTRYDGKEIVLTGRRSPYGFYAERYILPNVSPTGQ